MDKKMAFLAMALMVLVGTFALTNLVHRVLRPLDAVVQATTARPAQPVLINAVALRDTNRRAY